MMALLYAIVLSLLAVRSLADDDPDAGFSAYDNDFIEPNYIVEKNWNTTTVVAQESIIQWADWLAAQGPWCASMSFLGLSLRLIIPCSWSSCHNFQVFSCTIK